MLPFWKLGKTNMYHPFEFPFSGVARGEPTPRPPQGIPTDGSLDLINIPAGNSGVVREIHVISETNSGVQSVFNNLIINFKINGESTPSSSLPLASMVGNEHGDACTGPYETPFWTITNPINIGDSYYPPFNPDGVNQGLVLTYPINYTNGIHIYLTKVDYNLGPDSFWNNVRYQDNLPAVWNRNYKFHAVRSDELLTPPSAGPGSITFIGDGTEVVGTGTNFQATDVGKYLLVGIQDMLITSVTDTTHLTISSKNPGSGTPASYRISAGHTFLTRPAGTRGYLASVVLGVAGISGAEHLETNPRLRFNQEVDDAITLTGAEDFLKSAFYFDTIQQNSMGGVTAMDKVNGKYTGYTMNYHFPIPYIDGMSGHFPSVNTLNTQCNFTSVYYEEQ